MRRAIVASARLQGDFAEIVRNIASTQSNWRWRRPVKGAPLRVPSFARL